MHRLAPTATEQDIVYPDSDGQPMADNTLQFEWIVTIKGGLEALFHHRDDVFVAGDLLWYPVQGYPTIRRAPDALVAFGRPKGYRGSYKQWEEAGIAPHVVFEVRSPGNRPAEMRQKLAFYDQYGVEEYYMYDPEEGVLEGWLREGGRLRAIATMDGWISPRLGVRFAMDGLDLRLIRPDGTRFLSYLELEQQREQEHTERLKAEQQREQEHTERLKAEQQREQEHTERLKAEQRMHQFAAKLREMGVDPDTLLPTQ